MLLSRDLNVYENLLHKFEVRDSIGRATAVAAIVTGIGAVRTLTSTS
jgi:hypothetical protein